MLIFLLSEHPLLPIQFVIRVREEIDINIETDRMFSDTVAMRTLTEAIGPETEGLQ